MRPIPSPDPGHTLPWLLRLRWFALAGQIASVAVALVVLGLEVDGPQVAAGLLITALTNALLHFWHGHLDSVADDAGGVLLTLDTATLTLLLHATGGAHHPFAVFYLLHVVLAGLLLPPRWVAAQFALCLGCLAWLNFAPPTADALPPLPEPLRLAGSFIAVVLTGGGVAYFTASVQTALRDREARLAASRTRLAEQARFTGLATLAAGVAHELSTPLGTIVLASGELERLLASPAAREDARLIRREAERCRAIMSRLEAHAESGATVPIALAALPDAIAALLAPEHAARLRFTAPPGVHVHAPRAALEQCLAALVKNAAEADRSGAPVELRVTETDSATIFTVRDRGPGMDETTAARAGTPFFTTKGPGAGTGLGLYIVRMFAERLGGTVEISSAPGRGTTVSLALPRAHATGDAP